MLRDTRRSCQEDDRRCGGRVTITAKFVPEDIRPGPRESIASDSFAAMCIGFCIYVLVDMGTLRVDLLNGHAIAGAD